MPRFFFHTIDGGVYEDHDGVELPSRSTARIRYAGALLADRPDMLWDGGELRVRVVGEDGGHVATVVVLAIDGQAEDPATP